MQHRPQRKVMALAAGQPVEPDIQALGQPGRQAVRAGIGQRQQFAPAERQADRPAALLRLHRQTQPRPQLEMPGKDPGAAGEGGQQGALADTVRAGQADDLARPAARSRPAR